MKIPQSYKHHDYDFQLYKSEYMGESTQEKRKRYKAMYVAEIEGSEKLNIEVMILREVTDDNSKDNVVKPTTSEWGKWAWSYPTLKQAEVKYNEIHSNWGSIDAVSDF